MVIGFAFGPPNPFLDPQALLKNKKGVLNEMFQGTEYFMHNKKTMGFLFHWNILLSAIKPLISEECPLFVTYSY